jgi:beta-mannan synthase
VYDGTAAAAASDAGRLLLRAWEQVRSGLVVPLLKAAVVACAIMSVIVLAEKVFLGMVSLAVKLLRRRPGRMYRCDPIVPQDKEAGSAAFPMVLVQIPMYNEKEVCLVSVLPLLCVPFAS